MKRAFFPALLLAGLIVSSAWGEIVLVGDSADLLAAIETAQPGDEIVLAVGTYNIYEYVRIPRGGTSEAPIRVRAEALGDATILFRTSGGYVEGFLVGKPYWEFENLDIQGDCANHSLCEHAFHIVGEADHTVVRGCRMRDFNAQIKGNGDQVGRALTFPNDVLIEYNEFFNASKRDTDNPVTPLDVVGERRWTVRGNFVHDFEKGGSDQVSFAMFFKGNSREGIFERNLIICELLHAGGIRLGLSFGGGGSNPNNICEEGICTPEHRDGLMRNNIIVNCPADVGIYLNEAMNCGVYNNILYNTEGIDVRFAASVVDLRNNLLSADINNRDGGSSTRGANLEWVSNSQFNAWFVDAAGADFRLLDGASFVDLGENLGDVSDDFCTNERDDGFYDIGAVEYDGDGECDTTQPYHPPPPSDDDIDDDDTDDDDTDDDVDDDTDDDIDDDADDDTDDDTDDDDDLDEDDLSEDEPRRVNEGEDEACGC